MILFALSILVLLLVILGLLANSLTMRASAVVCTTILALFFVLLSGALWRGLI